MRVLLYTYMLFTLHYTFYGYIIFLLLALCRPERDVRGHEQQTRDRGLPGDGLCAGLQQSRHPQPASLRKRLCQLLSTSTAAFAAR